jgi:hypothetical protein
MDETPQPSQPNAIKTGDLIAGGNFRRLSRVAQTAGSQTGLTHGTTTFGKTAGGSSIV